MSQREKLRLKLGGSRIKAFLDVLAVPILSFLLPTYFF